MVGKDNYDLIEGPFGEKYTFRRVRPEDEDKVVKHIQDYFLHDEPASKLLGYTDQYGEEFGNLARKLFKDNLSFWVEDNENGEVAGVRVTFRHKKDTTFAGVKIQDYTFRMLVRQVGMCNDRCDLFKHYDLEEYADFFVASCGTSYRRQGITGEMYKRCLGFLKAEGFKMCKSVFNSPFTRHIALKLGFEEKARVYFKEVMNDQGKPAFKLDELNEEHFGSNLCKLL